MKAYHYVVVDPWVGFIMVMCSIHLMWVYILLIVQLFQVSEGERESVHTHTHERERERERERLTFFVLL